MTEADRQADAARHPYLTSVVAAAAAHRKARLDLDNLGRVSAVVTMLGERIEVDDLASAAEVLAYVHPTGTRPFDPRYLARYQPTTRRTAFDELDAAIDRSAAGETWA